MNKFAKIFDVGDQQVLFYIEPDTEANTEDASDPFKCHQITFKNGIKIDVMLQEIEAENAIRFLNDQNADTAKKIVDLLDSFLKVADDE